MSFNIEANVASERIAEGEVIFRITEYDKEKIEFGILFIKLENAKGQKHSERYDFSKDFSKNNLGRLLNAALDLGIKGNITITEDMVKEAVGKYVKATVKHNTYAAKDQDGNPLKDEDGNTVTKTAVNLSYFQHAEDFVDIDEDDLPF